MARKRFKPAFSPNIILGLLRLADMFIIALAAVLAFFTRHGEVAVPGEYYFAVVIAAFFTAYALQGVGLYVFDGLGRVMGQINKLFLAVPAVFIALVALGFFTKTSEDFSRIWFGAWFGFSFFGLVASRLVLSYLIERWRRAGKLTRNVVIVGAGEMGERLVNHIEDHPESGVRVVGIFDERITRVRDKIRGHDVLGKIDALPDFARANSIDQIVVALPWAASQRVNEILLKLKTLPYQVGVWPDWAGFQLRIRGVSELGGVPLLNIFERPLSDWSYVIKAAEDRVLGSLILLCASPLMLLMAGLVRLSSPGPILFRQERYGFNNDIFTVYKFRTMRHERAPEPGVSQAVRNDPRVTGVGRVLRRLSLDELPQLVNVIQGSMSLVGPRPHALAHHEQYAVTIDQYLARHRVKPGMTGWAQVNGLRGRTDTLDKMEKRIEYDLFYIENWSLLLDLRILILTVFAVLMAKDAY